MSLDASLWGRRRTVPVLTSSEIGECGVLCAVMLAKYHGHPEPVASLRRRLSASAQGTTLRGLLEICGGLGLEGRPLRVELSALSALRLPAILHLDFNHFVVLKRIAGARFFINDPSLGERVLTREELSRRFTGVCVEVTCKADFIVEAARQDSTLGRALRLSRAAAPAIASLAALSAGMQVALLAVPVVTQYLVDQVIPSGDATLLAGCVLAILAVGILDVAMGTTRSVASQFAASRFSWRVEQGLFAHMLRLPPAWFRARTPADVSMRLGLVEVVGKALVDALVDIAIEPIFAVAALALLALYAPAIAGLALLAVLANLALWAAARLAVRSATERETVARTSRSGYLLETVRAAVPIRLSGLGRHRAALFGNVTADVVNATLRRTRVQALLTGGAALTWYLNLAITLWLAAGMLARDELSLGAFVAVLGIRQMIEQKTETTTRRLAELASVGSHFERLDDLVLAEPEQDDLQARPTPAFSGLELRQVSFRYGMGAPNVIDSLDLAIRPGEFVTVVGPSGAGKSTLIRLVLGLATPTAGAVLYSGFPLNSLSLEHVRKSFAAVLQDDEVLQGSIFDNICLFDPEASPEAVRAAAVSAGLAADIARMPMQYQTLVGESGGLLSGGQRQRLLLARALYKKPEILVLDEATANIDEALETELVRTVRNLEVTRIVAAHRPAWLLAADRVFRLENGRLAEVARRSRAPIR